MPVRRRLAYVLRMAKSTMRRHRTATEWAQLIKSWEASGEGAGRFAQGRGVSPSSLYLWRKRLAEGPAGAGRVRRMDFVPVVVEDHGAEASGEQTRWSLETGSGLVLTMSGPDAVRGLEVALKFVSGEALR